MNFDELRQLYIDIKTAQLALVNQAKVLDAKIKIWAKEEPKLNLLGLVVVKSSVDLNKTYGLSELVQISLAPKLVEALLEPGEAFSLAIVPGTPILTR